PRLDGSGKLIAETGANPRGRYGVHFHRIGAVNTTDPVPVRGCVLVGTPGWGFVNHSSYVHFDNNVSFDTAGSGFVTEVGDEIGAFCKNLAIRSSGSGHDSSGRTDIQDFGHEGSGFWFQGAGLIVEGNIASGHRSAGFFYFTSGLIDVGPGR